MHKKIKFSYRAQVEPTVELMNLPFDEAWDKCGGKYPYKVIAIDGSVNANGWGVKSPRLKEFASKLPGLQVRTDHSDEFLAIAGEITDAKYDEEADRVIANAWTHEYEVAKRIHFKTGKDVSMQAETSEVECGSCGAYPIDECNCDDSWRSLRNPEPVEMSHVARGAYSNTKVISGFYAALDKAYLDVKNMDEIADTLKQINESIASLQADVEGFKAGEGRMPANPAPIKTDPGPRTKMPTIGGDDDPEVPFAPQDRAAMEEKDKKIAELEAKCKAMEDEKEKAAKAQDEEKEEEKAQTEDEKKLKASLQTSASHQSRRSQPGTPQSFKASGSDKVKPIATYDQFIAARDKAAAGPGQIEHPKPKTPNTGQYQAAIEKGYRPDAAAMMADLRQLHRDNKESGRVTTIRDGDTI
jgi:hypothetical protein